MPSFTLAAWLAAAGLALGAGLAGSAQAGAMKLTSVAFDQGGVIPDRYTCSGRDVSPPLKWSGVPAEARSLALACIDPDAPGGLWVHWVIWDLEPGAGGLAEAVPAEPEAAGGRQGVNDFTSLGYGGPCPPPGPAHRYVFRLYALSAAPGLDPGASYDELMDNIKGRVLAKAELMGRFGR